MSWKHIIKVREGRSRYSQRLLRDLNQRDIVKLIREGEDLKFVDHEGKDCTVEELTRIAVGYRISSVRSDRTRAIFDIIISQLAGFYTQEQLEEIIKDGGFEEQLAKFQANRHPLQASHSLGKIE